MAEAVDFSMFVTRDVAKGTAHMDLAVEGIGCAACIRKIEGGLRETPGIVEARVNFTNRRVAVDWDDRTLNAGEVIRALQRIGYQSHPFQPARLESDEEGEARWLLKCLGLAGFAAMNVMLLSVSVWSGAFSDMSQETRDLFHWLSALIALPAAAYAGQPFFRSAWRAVRTRQVNMDVPISVGVIMALGMSLFETATHAENAYFDSAIMLLFFLLCGRYLDHAMRRKTRAVAGNLAALKMETAHRFNEKGEIVAVPAVALHPGDRLLVRPGERVPADCTVISGKSEIDDSLVTGETARHAVNAGAMIYAGSLNFSGALTLRVVAAGTGTLIDEVQRLLDKAIQSKSFVVRLADRAARFYAPVVHLAAALTVLGWLLAGASPHQAIIAGISVLIITCPCALALAIPTVQVVASGALFRNKVIINSGDAIERLAVVDTIIFDKTGTLTLPEPQVDNAADIASDMHESAARLALSSRHPLAAAVARHARARTPYEGAIEIPGEGVRAVIDGIEARLGSPAFCGVHPGPDSGSSVIVYRRAETSVAFLIRQKVRPDAVKIVESLMSQGYDVRILSGDRSAAVVPIAEQLGIENWQGGLKPHEKIAAIEALKQQGRRVLMVGDGLNDAPALAAAHVSMSPITAADITQAQADAVFLGAEMEPVLYALATSRRAKRLMMQNLWLAVLYNIVAVPIAMAGYVTPLIAAAAMSGSSILVTLNALRVQPVVFGSDEKSASMELAVNERPL